MSPILAITPQSHVTWGVGSGPVMIGAPWSVSDPMYATFFDGISPPTGSEGQDTMNPVELEDILGLLVVVGRAVEPGRPRLALPTDD